ncbi:MAG: hypothetical protein HRT45_17100 [Bdellovibrionales bacterium]|nr:hypothetical protein [Bdellovibrionales bacterium]
MRTLLITLLTIASSNAIAASCEHQNIAIDLAIIAIEEDDIESAKRTLLREQSMREDRAERPRRGERGRHQPKFCYLNQDGDQSQVIVDEEVVYLSRDAKEAFFHLSTRHNSQTCNSAPGSCSISERNVGRRVGGVEIIDGHTIYKVQFNDITIDSFTSLHRYVGKGRVYDRGVRDASGQANDLIEEMKATDLCLED